MAKMEWLDAGIAALAVADNIMKRLQEKGLITQQDRDDIFDGAINDLKSAGGDMAKAAEGIRSLFNRP